MDDNFYYNILKIYLNNFIHLKRINYKKKKIINKKAIKISRSENLLQMLFFFIFFLFNFIFIILYTFTIEVYITFSFSIPLFYFKLTCGAPWPRHKNISIQNVFYCDVTTWNLYLFLLNHTSLIITTQEIVILNITKKILCENHKICAIFNTEM